MKKYEGSKYIFENSKMYIGTKDGLYPYNHRSGRIRRALRFIGGVVFGVVMLWALCWGMAIACVVAGGSVQVCGL